VKSLLCKDESYNEGQGQHGEMIAMLPYLFKTGKWKINAKDWGEKPKQGQSRPLGVRAFLQ
jgi:hypothetical protein